MKRVVLFLIVTALMGGPDRSAWAEVQTQMVSFPSGSETASGYLALPGSPGRHPAIIAIHEWWGLNDWVQEQAQKFAGLGYVVLAVDLYRGRTAKDSDEAHELSRGLPEDRALRDLKAAFGYLATRSDVDPGKIGDVGWCMGGGYSLKLAESEPRLAASVVNYGMLPTDPETIARIQAPVLGNFGALDRGIKPEDVHAFDKAMQSAGKKIDVKIYDGAGHAFENPNNKDGYRPQAAADAWTRMVSFFAGSLK